MKPKIRFAGGRVVVAFGMSDMAQAGGPLDVSLPLAAPVVAPKGTGWAGQYHIETHGKNDDEILAEINRVQIHHEKKSARLDGFQTLIGSSFTVAGQAYKVAHVSVGERGTDVELYASAIDNSGRRPPPITRVYPTMDDVPRDSEIIKLLRAAIADEFARGVAETAQAARLRNLLGGLP